MTKNLNMKLDMVIAYSLGELDGNPIARRWTARRGEYNKTKHVFLNLIVSAVDLISCFILRRVLWAELFENIGSLLKLMMQWSVVVAMMMNCRMANIGVKTIIANKLKLILGLHCLSKLKMF